MSSSEEDLPDDLRLIFGSRGVEHEVPAYPGSPTWVVGRGFEQVDELVQAALAAFLHACSLRGLPHSNYLGLDILISGELDSSGNVVDIRPTIVDGPCSNSNAADPYIDSYRLYQRALRLGVEPDRVEWPVHPTQIQETFMEAFRGLSLAGGGSPEPVVAILTRTYEQSLEETANVLFLQALRDAGLQAFRITPEEKPSVSNGKLTVNGVPIDVCYRRIRVEEMAGFYGADLADGILHGSPDTIYTNPWQVDMLRPKPVEEEVYREYEAAVGRTVSRPLTLIDEEITREAVADLFEAGGYVVKRPGLSGSGVFLHLNRDAVAPVFDRLYGRYDGRHMHLHAGSNLEAALAPLDDLPEGSLVQQLRVIDARNSDTGVRLAYDLRVNLIFNAVAKTWTRISGFSRGVPMGVELDGNSLLTNVSSGAHMSPLFIGPRTSETGPPMTFGPLLAALNRGGTAWRPI